MDVSIILVNYKSTAHIINCIRSVYEETSKHQFEIIIVDNNSEDGCEGKVKQQFPEVLFHQMGYNAGFARANNAGIRMSKGEFVLILNTDTIITDGAIDTSIHLLREHPEAVGCGVQLLNPDGTTQISGAHFIRGGLNTLLPLPYLGRLIRSLGYRFKSTVPSVQTIAATIEVDWIVGAYMLLRRSLLEKSGLFDEDFFMYAEEIEWCARIRKHGKLLLFAAPRVVHIGGGSSGDYYDTEEHENGKNLWNTKGRQIIISTLLRIRKQFGIGWFLLVAGIYLAEVPIFAVCLAVEKVFAKHTSRHSWRNVSAYTQNMGVLLSYFPRIILNRAYFYKVA